MTRSSAVPTSLVALVLLASGCGYNTIQTMDEEVNQAKGQIEAQLQRRADLIPNLVETVKGVAKQESTIFTSIAESRANLSGAVQSGDVGEMAAGEPGAHPGARPAARHRRELSRASLQRELSALQDQLEGTENRISVSRQDYNAVGGRVQRLHPAVSLQPDGQGARIGAARVLRGGAGVGDGAQGPILDSEGSRNSELPEARPRTRRPRPS